MRNTSVRIQKREHVLNGETPGEGREAGCMSRPYTEVWIETGRIESEKEASMEKFALVEKFVYLVKHLSDDDAEELLELIEQYIEQHGYVILEPIEEEKMTPEFLERLRHAREEMAQGEALSFEKVAKELGYGN